MSDNILRAEDISEALETIITDSVHHGVGVHRHFRSLSDRIINADRITGDHAELQRVQQQYAKDAVGLKVRERQWVTDAIRRFDESINARPRPMATGIIEDPSGTEQPVIFYDLPSVVRIP
jgi:hypothetical protein